MTSHRDEAGRRDTEGRQHRAEGEDQSEITRAVGEEERDRPVESLRFRAEAAEIHERSPFGVLIGLFVLPEVSAMLYTENQPSSFAKWVRRLRSRALVAARLGGAVGCQQQLCRTEGQEDPLSRLNVDDQVAGAADQAPVVGQDPGLSRQAHSCRSLS